MEAVSVDSDRSSEPVNELDLVVGTWAQGSRLPLQLLSQRSSGVHPIGSEGSRLPLFMTLAAIYGRSFHFKGDRRRPHNPPAQSERANHKGAVLAGLARVRDGVPDAQE
jgi:hypothetical protein